MWLVDAVAESYVLAMRALLTRCFGLHSYNKEFSRSAPLNFRRNQSTMPGP